MKSTRKRRLQVLVSPEFHDLILEMAAISDCSVSSVVSEMLEQLHPAFQVQLEYLKKAVSLIQSGEKIKTESKHSLISELEAHKEKLQAQVDSSLSDVLESIEKA